MRVQHATEKSEDTVDENGKVFVAQSAEATQVSEDDCTDLACNG
jgi:hypothetical protein